MMTWDTATPVVFKLVGMRLTPRGEVIYGEDADGVRFWFDPARVGLAGWVEQAMKLDPDVAPLLSVYVEIGRRDEGGTYLDLLLTPEEFDGLPASELLREMNEYNYEDWRSSHRVDASRCPNGRELYYAAVTPDALAVMLMRLQPVGQV